MTNVKLPKAVGTLKVSDFVKMNLYIAKKLKLNLCNVSDFKKMVEYYLISLN